MNIENLVTMANQIGEYFSAYADRREGEREIANHLRKFWEPRMRRAIFTQIDAHGKSGFDDIVFRAILEHRTQLEPVHHTPA